MRFPADRSRGIGIIGAGLIINNAHMPAYRKAGFNVTAIYDVRRDAAEQTAERFGIPIVCDSVEELVRRDDVTIVDMAVTPEGQIEASHLAIEAGKHVLCHKPLAERYAEAVALVDEAEKAGTLLAVNQQMRWSPGIHFTRLLAEQGVYGEITECSFDVDLLSNWGWMGERARVEYFYNSIHYHDALRSILGEPLRVLASSAMYPGQRAHAETRSFTVMEYANDLRTIVVSNHNNWSSSPRAVLKCHGTEARTLATLGMKDYPIFASDTFECTLRSDTSVTLHKAFEQRWIPDAFIYPMADLMLAIEEGRTPVVSGRDNLGTLRIVEAAYRSIEEGRRVDVAEIDA